MDENSTELRALICNNRESFSNKLENGRGNGGEREAERRREREDVESRRRERRRREKGRKRSRKTNSAKKKDIFLTLFSRLLNFRKASKCFSSLRFSFSFSVLRTH